MIYCKHCEAEATESAPEGAALNCETCGILGTVVLRDEDCEGEAVAYLRFEANDGALCNWDGCEECADAKARRGDEERAERLVERCEMIGVEP